MVSTSWFFGSWDSVWRILISAVVMLFAVIALIRLIGLRALSKMSGFDFAVTVAIGSILGSSVATNTPVVSAVVAVASLLALQWSIAQFRRRAFRSRLVDNQPLLLSATVNSTPRRWTQHE